MQQHQVEISKSLLDSSMNKRFNRILIILFVLGSLLILFKPSPLLNDTSFSTVVYDRNGNLLRLTLSSDEKYRIRSSIEETSPLVIKAILLQEDKYFYWHLGINPISIIRAFYETYIIRKKRVGASTITMQLARLRYKINTKSLSGKVIQILRALQLELFCSKQSILNAYLNLLPFGRNIEGIQAASLIYFKKNPDKLNLTESLTLCVIPKNPYKRSPEKENKGNKSLSTARNVLNQKWRQNNSQNTRKKGHSNILPITKISDLPFEAPHFVDSVLKKNPDNIKLITTLDLKLQKLLERHILQYILRKKNIGVENASAMLIDTRTLGILGCVGSVDFYNKSIDGQVNGTESKRSPGSTLKPFVYALGIDQGLIHSLSMLKDSPTRFGHYDPENFERDFIGPIKVKDALILSRNVPAVQMTSHLNNPDLHDFLIKSKVKGLREKDYYGLALVLGGAELSMVELLQLYAMLINNGIFKSLNYVLPSQKKNSMLKLLSPEACFMILDILKENPPPEDNIQRTWTKQSINVYWKTGTSVAFRDAWSIALFGPYALAVWIGNFDGKSNPNFIGRNIAAPLLFEIIDSIISYNKSLKQYINDRTINKGTVIPVEVCSISGQIMNRNCSQSITTWFIPGKSPIDKCTIHREILINTENGLRSCGSFAKKIRIEVYEFWQTDLLKLFKIAGIPRRTPPPYDPRCNLTASIEEGSPPQIISPIKNIQYNIRINNKNQNTIPLTAICNIDIKDIFWFVDESYIGKTKVGDTLFWKAVPGKYFIRAVDNHGQSDVQELSVVLAK